MGKLVQGPIHSCSLRARAVYDLYKSIGLNMIEAISNWIKGTPPPGRSTSHKRATVLSNTDAATIDN